MNRWSERLPWVGWWLLVIGLPFTSLPLAARVLRSEMVAPASAVILIGWVGLWLAPFLWKGGKLPRHGLPLLGWLSTMVVSAGLAYFLTLPVYRFEPIWKREFEGIVTLLIGLCFYFVTVAWVKDEQRLRFTLRWVNWSGVIPLVWSAAQFVMILLPTRIFPEWMWSVQELISTGGLHIWRVTGVAFEPSWLAHQLNVLYLPIWLSAAFTGQTAHRLRWGPVTLERALAIAGLATLFLSKSRIGLVSAVLMIGVLALIFLQKRWEIIQPRLLGVRYALPAARRLATLGLYVLLAVLMLGLLLGIGWSMSRFDNRMAQVFDVEALRDGSLAKYANQLLFAERLLYWEAGWEVFEQHPLLGVGPNNSGLFFPQTLDAFAWGLDEVRTIFYEWDSVPNPKNLWVRILAETGLVGFAMFLSWLVLIGLSARQLFRHSDALGKWVGLAGVLALAALLVEGFSLDTYALPYWWMMCGLVTAAWTGWYNRAMLMPIEHTDHSKPEVRE